MPLRAPPYFNTFGNVDDTVAMVEKMRKRYPDNFIALAGLSVGSGQVVKYVCREGDRVQINAVASLCPGWELRVAVAHFYAKHPIMDRYMTRMIKKHFLEKERNQEALRSMPEALMNSRQATYMHEFLEASAPFAGYQNLEHLYEENDPNNFLGGNKVPCLVLNALDDFISLKENIRYDYIRDKVKNYVLLVTDEGGHLGYNEGSLGQDNYMWRVTLDFFDTIRCLNYETNHQEM